MKRRSVFAALCAFVTSAFCEESAPRMQLAAGKIQYTVYTVTDPAAFLALRFPVGLVFWNGIFLTPGVAYDIAGSTFKLRDLPLTAGETLTIGIVS
jgi:hypothetical protein